MYILHELQLAVGVTTGLRHTLAHWRRIAAGLKDPPRRRPRQQTILGQKIEAYDQLC